MFKNPIVSIIVPCRNEERFIRTSIESIIDNDYPKECLEILFVDGMSTDKTLDILRDYKTKNNNIKILRNPKLIFPTAINIGIKESSGDFIMIMGAHAAYAKDYISKCISYFSKYKADNIGGLLLNVSQKENFISDFILITRKSPFGAGNATHRTGTSKPVYVDTVFGGCYKREVFERIGYFNENLVRSADMEFNIRLKKNDGKTLMVPDAIATYYTRTSLIEFLKMNFSNGIWAIKPLLYTKYIPLSLRHFIPFFFVSGLFGLLILSIFNSFFLKIFISLLMVYFVMSILYSFKYLKERFLNIIFLPIFFFLLHFSYGIGSLYAFLIIPFLKITWIKPKT